MHQGGRSVEEDRRQQNQNDAGFANCIVNVGTGDALPQSSLSRLYCLAKKKNESNPSNPWDLESKEWTTTEAVTASSVGDIISCVSNCYCYLTSSTMIPISFLFPRAFKYG